MKSNKKIKYSMALSGLVAFPSLAGVEHVYFNASSGYYFNFDEDIDDHAFAVTGKVGYHLDNYFAMYFKYTDFDAYRAQGFGIEYKKHLSKQYQLLHSISANSTSYESGFADNDELLPEFGFGVRYIDSPNYSIDAVASLIGKDDFSGFNAAGFTLGVNFGPGGAFGYQANSEQPTETVEEDLSVHSVVTDTATEVEEAVVEESIVETPAMPLPTEPALDGDYNEWSSVAEFDHNSAVTRIDAEVLSKLSNRPVNTITLYGHTDNKGPQSYNVKLGYQRAEAVKAALIRHGISAEKIKVRSHGELKPLVENNSDRNRAKNRRVSLKVEWLAEQVEAPVNTPVISNTTTEAPSDSNYSQFDYKNQFNHKDQWNSVAVFSKNGISAKIKPEIIQELLSAEYQMITLYGHTDGLGAVAHNTRLGYLRAESIREQLIIHGIDNNKIKVRSAGADQPLKSNDTQAGRAINRRVSLVLQK